MAADTACPVEGQQTLVCGACRGDVHSFHWHLSFLGLVEAKQLQMETFAEGKARAEGEASRQGLTLCWLLLGTM